MLLAFHNSDTFEEGALLAVNLGDEAETTLPSSDNWTVIYINDRGTPDRTQKPESVCHGLLTITGIALKKQLIHVEL